MYTVIETPKFEQASKKIWNEKERSEFFAYLSQNPFVGDVVQQGKGVRKVRWSYQGQGKRGGVRVLYFNVLQSGFILMVDIYTKNEKENISDAELKKITELKIMDISATIKEVTKDWDIEAMVQAIIADDPEMEAHREELKISLSQAKNGEIGRITYASPIAETRHRANLTQSKFAERLGISLATLRSWEQGVRQPSGAAKTLLDLLYRKPELINDLHV